jgi:transposase
MMTCPRCKKSCDILQYKCLEQIQEYIHETVPVYKCPNCKWMFSIAGDMPHDIYQNLQDQINTLLEIVSAKGSNQ